MEYYAQNSVGNTNRPHRALDSPIPNAMGVSACLGREGRVKASCAQVYKNVQV
jgi:hypothetical protein